jgi:hypothetical protein
VSATILTTQRLGWFILVCLGWLVSSLKMGVFASFPIGELRLFWIMGQKGWLISIPGLCLRLSQPKGLHLSLVKRLKSI